MLRLKGENELPAIQVEERNAAALATHLDQHAKAKWLDRQAAGLARALPDLPGPKFTLGDFIRCQFLKHAPFVRTDQRKAAAERLREVYRAKVGAWEDVSLKTALAETAGQTGGYLTPQSLAAEALAPLAELSVFRAHAMQVFPTPHREVLVPTPDYSQASAAGLTSLYGGLKISFCAEGNTLSQGEPKTKQLSLVKNVAGGILTVSNALLLDSDIDSWMPHLLVAATAWFETYYLLNGSGVGQPLGLINAPATQTVNRATGNQIKPADVEAMVAKMLPQAWDSSVWGISISALGQLMTNFPAWVPNGPLMLMGRPVVPLEQLPALGTKGDLILFSPPWVALAQTGPGHGEIEIAVSPHTKLTSNQTDIRIIRRWDAQPMADQGILLQDQATTVAPYVVLV